MQAPKEPVEIIRRERAARMAAMVDGPTALANLRGRARDAG